MIAVAALFGWPTLSSDETPRGKFLLSDPADRVVSLLLPACEPPPCMPRIMNSIMTGHARATNT